jgi:hypothetical protein
MFTAPHTGDGLPSLHVLLKLSQASVKFAELSPIQNKNGSELLTGIIQFCDTTSQILTSFLVIFNVTTSLPPTPSVAVF